jgi:hypothetical protein
LGGFTDVAHPPVNVVPEDEGGQIAVDVKGDIIVVTSEEANPDLEGRAPASSPIPTNCLEKAYVLSCTFAITDVNLSVFLNGDGCVSATSSCSNQV